MSCAVNSLFNRLQVNGAVGRLYLFFVAFTVAVITWHDVGLTGHIFNWYGGGIGDFVSGLMFVSSVLGTFDTLINDVLPERYNWRWTLKRRHMILMSLSCSFAVGAYMCARSAEHGGLWVLPYFAVTSLMFLASAFFDVRRRFKKPHPEAAV